MDSLSPQGWRHLVNPPKVFPIQSWSRGVMIVASLPFGLPAIFLWTYRESFPESIVTVRVLCAILGALAAAIILSALFYRAFVILDERGIVLKRPLSHVTIPWDEVSQSDVWKDWSENGMTKMVEIVTAKRKIKISNEFEIYEIQKIIRAVRSAQVAEEAKST